MKAFKIFGGALGIAAALAAAPASAEDQLRVAIGQINNWENQAPHARPGCWDLQEAWPGA